MKRSREFMNFILSAGFLLTLSTPVMAAEQIQVTPPETQAEVLAPEVTIPEELKGLLLGEPSDNQGDIESQVSTYSVENFALNESGSMGNLDTGVSMQSIHSVTHEFNDYLSTSYDQKYVQFPLMEGEIVNLTLLGPKSDYIDYDLILAYVSPDGSATEIRRSNLATYTDKDTPVTAAEGISYVHRGSDVGYYAAFVVSSRGSSTTETFKLTVSFDGAGSYDSNETNDSPFEAKYLDYSGTTGSLHVSNDQDWYRFTAKSGLHEITAGDYDVDVYANVSGLNMKLIPEAGTGRFNLSDGTYYVKVHSEKSVNDFEFGNYNLNIANISKYNTFETAYDLGAWEYSYTRSPSDIPYGQTEAFYKFSIDSSDKAYIFSSLSKTHDEPVVLVVYDNNRNPIGLAYSRHPELGSSGVITSSSGYTSLAVNIDGTNTRSYGYIQVIKGDYSDSSSIIPRISKRIYTGFDTFKFSGTSSNSGFGYSSILYLDLSRNSSIPNGAVVTGMDTYGSMSSSVGGVTHYLGAMGSQRVFESTYNSATRGSFKVDPSLGIPAKQLWAFQYYQSAFASTSLRNIEVKLSWEYDISQTNYQPVY